MAKDYGDEIHEFFSRGMKEQSELTKRADSEDSGILTKEGIEKRISHASSDQEGKPLLSSKIFRTGIGRRRVGGPFDEEEFDSQND